MSTLLNTRAEVLGIWGQTRLSIYVPNSGFFTYLGYSNVSEAGHPVYISGVESYTEGFPTGLATTIGSYKINMLCIKY